MKIIEFIMLFILFTALLALIITSIYELACINKWHGIGGVVCTMSSIGLILFLYYHNYHNTSVKTNKNKIDCSEITKGFHEISHQHRGAKDGKLNKGEIYGIN